MTRYSTPDQLCNSLPEPLPVSAPGHAGYAAINGIDLYFSTYGQGEPIILLHGGIGSSDWWGGQIDFLVRHRYRVVVMDSRGNGRSTRSAQPFSYPLMASDVLGLMDYLEIPRAAIVGWSDGAVVGLDIAIRHPDRLSRLFAFGMNTALSGVRSGFEETATFQAATERGREEYVALSRTPDDFDAFIAQISVLWIEGPGYTHSQLVGITTPVTVVAAQYDEAILMEHSRYISQTIPGAGFIELPSVSHFAPLQDPAGFNRAILEAMQENEGRA